VDVAIQRGNNIVEKQIQPDAEGGSEEYGSVGWQPDQPVTVNELVPNMPAVGAGIKLNDQIAAINGTPMRSVFSVIHYLQQNGDKPVDVTVVRDGKTSIIKMTPVQTEESGQKGYRLGFLIAGPMRVEKLPFGKAFSMSLQENKRYSLLIVDLVQKMVEHKVSIKQMEGPIGIARASGDAARQPGWTPLLGLMAMISLNLGVFNLLPIPILDGGVILTLLIEMVMGRDLSLNVKEAMLKVGFVFLMMLVVFVIYNDIAKRFTTG
jgi:regulator of sigma E protease